MAWRPGAEDDLFEVERLEDGIWRRTSFADLKQGAVFRTRYADAWIDPMSFDFIDAPVLMMCLRAPFKNRETGVGYQCEVQTIAAADMN